MNSYDIPNRHPESNGNFPASIPISAVSKHVGFDGNYYRTSRNHIRLTQPFQALWQVAGRLETRKAAFSAFLMTSKNHLNDFEIYSNMLKMVLR